jgi:hypothetical protein
MGGLVMPDDQPRQLTEGQQRGQLVQAAGAARSGAPLPWSDESHRRRCVLCRDHADQLDALEAGYLNWIPTADLALQVGVGSQVIREHAAAYLWDLRRCAELAPAYSKLIESGVQAALDGQATPAHALQALRDMQRSSGRSARVSDPADEQAGTRQVVESEGGAVVLSYEEKIRRVRAELTGGADPRQVIAQLAGADRQLDDDNNADDNALDDEADADPQPDRRDDPVRQAAALLDLGDGTRTSRRRAAAQLVKAGQASPTDQSRRVPRGDGEGAA